MEHLDPRTPVRAVTIRPVVADQADKGFHGFEKGTLLSYTTPGRIMGRGIW